MRLGNADRFWTNSDLRSLNESLLGPHAHGMLRSLLASMLSEPQFLAACKLKWAEFKPRQKLTAYFEAEVNCPNQSRIKAWPLAAVWQPTHILNSSRESSVSLAE